MEVEGWRGLNGWRDGISEPDRAEPQEGPQRTARTETESKPIRESETNRNETRLYWAFRKATTKITCTN